MSARFNGAQFAHLLKAERHCQNTDANNTIGQCHNVSNIWAAHVEWFVAITFTESTSCQLPRNSARFSGKNLRFFFTSFDSKTENDNVIVLNKNCHKARKSYCLFTCVSWIYSCLNKLLHTLSVSLRYRTQIYAHNLVCYFGQSVGSHQTNARQLLTLISDNNVNRSH